MIKAIWLVWLTTYKTLQIPDSLDLHKYRDDSTASMEKTAPEIAPIPAPRSNPLSVAKPIRAPVIAPTNEPTAHKKKKTASKSINEP